MNIKIKENCYYLIGKEVNSASLDRTYVECRIERVTNLFYYVK